MLIKKNRLIILIVLIAAIVLVGYYVLPNIARLSWLETVRNNMKHDIEATAYFYTEVEDYRVFEKEIMKAVSKKNKQEKRVR